MDLARALAATDADRGPRSNLEKFLADIEGTPTHAEVLAELKGTRQAAHLARALSLLSQSGTISGQSVTKWRATHGS